MHHTNEIAQSESVTGEVYVNYWMHINFLNDHTGKRSKSHDDFLTLSSLTSQNHSALAYKYFLLTTHYRKEVSFSYEALLGAEVAYQKLVAWCADHKTVATATNSTYLTEFEKALYDDLATPSCIALMWKLIKDDMVSDDVLIRKKNQEI